MMLYKTRLLNFLRYDKFFSHSLFSGLAICAVLICSSVMAGAKTLHGGTEDNHYRLSRKAALEGATKLNAISDINNNASAANSKILDLKDSIAVEVPVRHQLSLALNIVGSAPRALKTAGGQLAGWISSSAATTAPVYGDGRIYVGSGRYLRAFDCRTGKSVWQTAGHLMDATIVGEPVYGDGRIAVNTASCTLYVIDAASGGIRWQKWLAVCLHASPAIANHCLYVTWKGKKHEDFLTWQARHRIFERLRGKIGAPLGLPITPSLHFSTASYLACAALKPDAPSWIVKVPGEVTPVVDGDSIYVQGTCLDARNGNINCKSQITRNVSSHGVKVSVAGRNVEAKDSNTGRLLWRVTCTGLAASSYFFPPSMGKDNVYLAATDGHIISLDLTDGSLRFAYATQQPIWFQPVLAEGRIYVVSKGSLLCINANDKDADGWYSPDGNSAHNGCNVYWNASGSRKQQTAGGNVQNHVSKMGRT